MNSKIKINSLELDSIRFYLLVEVYISDCWKKHVGKSMIKHGSDKSLSFWRKIASDIDFKCMKDIPEKEVHCFSAVSLGVSHHMNFLMDW